LFFIFSQWHLFAQVMLTLTVLKQFDKIKNTLGLRLLFRRPFSLTVHASLAGKAFCNHVIVEIIATAQAILQAM